MAKPSSTYLCGMAQFSAGAVIGSFAASLLLFVPPVTLLGMVTPFAIRLGMNDVTRAGQVAGRVFALSTVGSLLGTFLPALLTIPLVGTQRTLLGCAVLIAVSGASFWAATPSSPCWRWPRSWPCRRER